MAPFSYLVIENDLPRADTVRPLKSFPPFPPGRIEVIDDAEIDDESKDNIVLIQPQKVKLLLRPGECSLY